MGAGSNTLSTLIKNYSAANLLAVLPIYSAIAFAEMAAITLVTSIPGYIDALNRFAIATTVLVA